MESTSGVQNQLNTYTHSEAIDFAAATWNWQQRNRNLVLKPNKSSVEIPTHEIETGLRAYYRVLVMKKDKYILIACHINLHGFHRGDLRFVEVNKRTIVKGFEFSVIGELFPGDVVAVTKLGRRSRAKFQPVDVFSVHPDADCTWEVLNMTLLTRKADQLVDFAVLKNGVAVCEGHVEAMNVIPNTREPLELDKMYEGLAFIPETIEFNYTQDLSAGRVGLIALASHLHSYPNVLRIGDGE
uniref:S1 motif domain-containing protein n=1 Tax=Caenorhabditis tropicalis TaxID=1561998 RepID=A0A1I7SZ32_9PELO